MCIHTALIAASMIKSSSYRACKEDVHKQLCADCGEQELHCGEDTHKQPCADCCGQELHGEEDAHKQPCAECCEQELQCY
jgi:hypothetical protein